MANISSVEKHILKETHFACLRVNCGRATIKTHFILKISATKVDESYDVIKYIL